MKARQVECQYLQCLASEVPTGADPATCVSMRAFGWCMFVYGEVFQLIPFAQFIKSFLNAFIGAFKDVWSIVGLAMGMACWTFTTGNTDEWFDQACTIAKLPKQLEEVYENVKGFGEASSWGLEANSCKAAIKKADEVIKAHDAAKAQEEEQFVPPPPPAPPAPVGE